MQFAVMGSTKRDREFITDLLPEPAWLCKTQVVWVAGLAAANEAGLLCHESKMVPASLPLRLRKSQHAFVDARRNLVAGRWRDQFGWREVLIRR